MKKRSRSKNSIQVSQAKQSGKGVSSVEKAGTNTTNLNFSDLTMVYRNPGMQLELKSLDWRTGLALFGSRIYIDLLFLFKILFLLFNTINRDKKFLRIIEVMMMMFQSLG